MTTLIYPDHNILDAFLKGRISNDYYFKRHESERLVYSDETLREIRESKGYEDKFIQVLRDLDASYLFVELDTSGRATGTWEVQEGDPLIRFDRLNDALGINPINMYGLDEITQKLYGGASEVSYTDILGKSVSTFDSEIDTALQNGRSALSDEEYQMFVQYFNELKSQLKSTSKEMALLFDKEIHNDSLALWDKTISGGPKELNNIKPPNVVEQVWKKIAASSPEDYSLRQFFRLEPLFVGDAVPQNDIERCNTLYQVLNYCGYYRDSKMKQLRRVRASLSDMTHAGYASLCNVVWSGDKDFCRKALAAYDYLNIGTYVVYQESDSNK